MKHLKRLRMGSAFVAVGLLTYLLMQLARIPSALFNGFWAQLIILAVVFLLLSYYIGELVEYFIKVYFAGKFIKRSDDDEAV